MTTKDSNDKNVKIHTLKRLDGQIKALCQSGRYAEASQLTEKALRLAASIFPAGHSVLASYARNLSAVKKMASGSSPVAKPGQSAKPGQTNRPGQTARLGQTVKGRQSARSQRAMQHDPPVQQVQTIQVKEADGPDPEVGSGQGTGSAALLSFNWNFALRAAAVTLAMAMAVATVLPGLINAALLKNPSTISEPAYANSGQKTKEAAVPLYKVKASFSPENRVVGGEEEISFNNPLPRKEILLNLYFNRYRNSSLDRSEMRQYAFKDGVDRGSIDILWVTAGGEPVAFAQTGEILRLSPNGNHFPAGEMSIRIGFKLKIPGIPDRSGGNKDGIWLGNWLPTLSAGKEIVPTEIGDAYINASADYETEFTVPKGYKLVLSDTYSVEDTGNNRVYKSRLRRVRDLPVFLNRGYREAVIHNGDTDIHYYFKSNNSRPVEVMEIAKKSLLFYENYVGDYPWKQLNIVENDMYLNGMEYSTLLLLSSKAINKNMEQTIFHEVGHQWFYNILGNDQYDAAFIDEGFVEFLTWYGLEKQEPKYYEGLSRFGNDLSKFNSWRDYREVHYRDGRKLFESIYVLLGKTEFEKFIKEYYDKYKFALVSSEEFKRFLSEKIGEQRVQKILRK